MICRHTLLRRNVAEHVLLLLVFSPHRSSCRTLTFFLASSGDQRGAFFNKLLVLLCYKKGAPQKGQLESWRSRMRAMAFRRVAMEQGLCRSRRIGRAPRAELGRHFGEG